MSPPRIRITIRSLMILVGLLAVCAWVLKEWRSYQDDLPQPVFPKTYYVGDLVGGPEASPRRGLIANPNTAGLDAIVKRLKGSVTPESWANHNLFAVLNRDEVMIKAIPYAPSHSIIMWHTPDGHDQVAAWLAGERRKHLAASRQPGGP